MQARARQRRSATRLDQCASGRVAWRERLAALRGHQGADRPSCVGGPRRAPVRSPLFARQVTARSLRLAISQRWPIAWALVRSPCWLSPARHQRDPMPRTWLRRIAGWLTWSIWRRARAPNCLRFPGVQLAPGPLDQVEMLALAEGKNAPTRRPGDGRKQTISAVLGSRQRLVDRCVVGPTRRRGSTQNANRTPTFTVVILPNS